MTDFEAGRKKCARPLSGVTQDAASNPTSAVTANWKGRNLPELGWRAARNACSGCVERVRESVQEVRPTTRPRKVLAVSKADGADKCIVQIPTGLNSSSFVPEKRSRLN